MRFIFFSLTLFFGVIHQIHGVGDIILYQETQKTQEYIWQQVAMRALPQRRLTNGEPRFPTYREVTSALLPYVHSQIRQHYQDMIYMMFSKFKAPRHDATFVLEGWRCLLKKILRAQHTGDPQTIIEDQKAALMSVLAMHKRPIFKLVLPDVRKLRRAQRETLKNTQRFMASCVNIRSLAHHWEYVLPLRHNIATLTAQIQEAKKVGLAGEVNEAAPCANCVNSLGYDLMGEGYANRPQPLLETVKPADEAQSD